MNSIYFMPYNYILFLLMITIIAIIFEAISLIHDLFSYDYVKHALSTLILDGAIFLNLFIFLSIIANIIFNVNDNFYFVKNYSYLRYLIYILIVIAGMIVIIDQKDIFSLIIIFNSTMLLPISESILGQHYPIIVLLGIAFYLFRSLCNLFLYHQWKKDNLSFLSIKEALDTLDYGLLFCRKDGKNDGQILLTNTKMQDLMSELVGRYIYNGKLFYNLLNSGEGITNAKKEPLANQIVYSLKDGSVWNFEIKSIHINDISCVLMVAYNTTNIQNATLELYHKQQELKLRNQELNEMLNNLENLCISEETLNAKTRVHDLLGQRISLILRAIRQHQEPENSLLYSIANGLLEELKNPKINQNYSLAKLVDSFKALNINVHIDGNLPENPKLKDIFYKIIAEAMTNSVRHGLASEIFIKIDHLNGKWSLIINDNGIVKEEIVEGGGLLNMHHMVKELNGEFNYFTKPNFKIVIKISDKELL